MSSGLSSRPYALWLEATECGGQSADEHAAGASGARCCTYWSLLSLRLPLAHFHTLVRTRVRGHKRNPLPSVQLVTIDTDAAHAHVFLCAEGWGADEILGKSMSGWRLVMAHFCLWGPLCSEDACCLKAAKFSQILSARMYAPEEKPSKSQPCHTLLVMRALKSVPWRGTAWDGGAAALKCCADS